MIASGKKAAIGGLLAAFLLGCGVTWAAPEIRLHEALQPHEINNPQHPAVAMVGDSHTRIADWSILTGCDRIANFGVSGNNSAQVLARISKVVEAEPKIALLMVGTNDALQHIPFETTRLNISKITETLRQAGIEPVLFAPPPLPSLPNAIDRIASLASARVPFTASDLLADGIHLRRSGYAKWRDAITDLVKRFC